MPAAGASIAFSLPVLVAAGVLARVLGILAGAAAVLPEVAIRIRIALAVAITAVALPLAVAAQESRPAPTPAGGTALFVVVGEAAVGLAFGALLAALVSAGGWAGGVLGSAAGLSWADDFDPEGGTESAGCARFAWWTSAGVFLAGGGLEAIAVGIIDSLRVLPVGTLLPASGLPRPSLEHVAADVPAIACALALALAVPALLAVLAFHLAAAIALRTVPFAPGAGFLQGLAAVVLLGALFVGADAWARGFPGLVQGPIERVFAAGER
jgi:flagellar biosynthesis protein FliR